ncbi:hypothetical protein SAMN05428988_4389 [Chitinophaga sp. YR573]|nr:hypothetical protein SAMN05428988_4389 [Chitinophaga sp. YR573]
MIIKNIVRALAIKFRGASHIYLLNFFYTHLINLYSYQNNPHYNK